MNKKKSLATSTIISLAKKNEKPETEESIDTSDRLILKIFSLRVSDPDLGNYVIKVSFLEQLLVQAIIKPIGARDQEPEYPAVLGSMDFDPADYEKMCLFADYPLVAEIHSVREAQYTHISQNQMHMDHGDDVYEHRYQATHISCCNVDILPIFTDMKDDQKICIKKRMEPMVQPPALKLKSWDTLPLLTMELTAERNPCNISHHEVLREANWMKLTLMASYNMLIPFEEEFVYTAASKAPSQAEEDENVGVVTFSHGRKKSRSYDSTSFFPKWESLRSHQKLFTNGDQKLKFQLEDFQNESGIDLPFYLNSEVPFNTVVWGSFHRTLILKDDTWLWQHFRKYKWPFELQIQGKDGGYSFMAHLNLFRLLYPGEHTIRLVVPLQWINAETMMDECGCELLLIPFDKPPSTIMTEQQMSVHGIKGSKTSRHPESYATSDSTLTNLYKPTGGDDSDALVVLEIQLGRPLNPIFIPPVVLTEDLGAMLTKMELDAPKKRICTGRGQLEHDWQKTVRSAANSLRKVPYYGPTEFCTFNRQLSETRTRVELTTSCWQDAAVFVNNQFVVQQYLHSDEVFEELMMMAHACLMKSAANVLLRADQLMLEAEPALRAARHAHQMQDTIHAMEIYLRLVVENPRNADYWRALSTVVKDIDKDCARVCLDRAVLLNTRHPLTLISKGAMLFEEDPKIAEPFFLAVLMLHPSWPAVWTIASVYFYERELFHMAEVTITVAKKYYREACAEDSTYRRWWEMELGSWWEPTPILPGRSPYYDAADLLVRLRAVSLAEVCTARALSVGGETPQYYHLVSLCCRLRGEFAQAKCLIDVGLAKFGEINYLRSLEAEIQHKLGNFKEAIKSFGRVSNCASSYTALMSLASGTSEHSRTSLLDIIRRNPSAYAWMVLAEDWLSNPPPPEKTKIAQEGPLDEGMRKTARLMKAKASAIACAIQALKIDRQAGRAWATLGKFVKPKEKRIYCLEMAVISGWRLSKQDFDIAEVSSQHSFCHDIGTALRECRCQMCDKTQV